MRLIINDEFWSSCKLLYPLFDGKLDYCLVFGLLDSESVYFYDKRKPRDGIWAWKLVSGSSQLLLRF